LSKDTQTTDKFCLIDVSFLGGTAAPASQASLAHFRMKLFLAAPESSLPSALTAFGKHVSRLHFLMKLLSAAPANGLPFLSTALLAHVSCAIAAPIQRAAIALQQIKGLLKTTVLLSVRSSE
jgi:hypothetical protein